MIEQIISNSRFALGKKWFWIGIVISLLSIAGGLVYGIALAIEKDRRREGLIIIALAVVWTLVVFYFIGPWLVKAGLMPKLRVVR